MNLSTLGLGPIPSIVAKSWKSLVATSALALAVAAGCSKDDPPPWSPYSTPTIDEIQVYSPSGTPSSPHTWPTVTGVIVESGHLMPSAAYIHDGTGGIRILSNGESPFVIGDEVELEGEVSSNAYFEISLYVRSYSVLSEGNAVLPRPMSVGEAISTYENVGEFVSVIGTITDLDCNFAIGGFCFSDSAATIRVSIAPFSDFDYGELIVGDSYEITGVLTKVYTEIFLQPRFRKDLKLIPGHGTVRWDAPASGRKETR